VGFCQLSRNRTIAVTMLFCVMSAALLRAADTLSAAVSLDSGYSLLYDLQFDQAHQIFSSWDQAHPQDPLGPVSDAAGLLFSEFQRLGVLESQFYADDHKFEQRKKLTPDEELKKRLDERLQEAEKRAQRILARDPKDRDALFAMTLATGLRADYAALIDKSNLSSLHYTRTSTDWSQQLLAVDPTCYDAHLAAGISKYIIGSMSAPVRWLLRIGGVSGDKKAGVAELQLTADHGRYLAPFARILLAIAAVRDHDTQRAKELLAGLRDQYPDNPLFAREIARLESVR